MGFRRKEVKPAPPEQLAWRCPPEWLSFRTTAEIKSFHEATRQKEAVAALRLGLRIRARGYNIYVAGLPGTGRSSTVRRIMDEERQKGPVPDDLLYVHNLGDPRSPRFLRLPPGKGRALRDAMAAATNRYRQGLAALRASGAHRRRREKVAHKFRDQQTKIVGAFQEEVAQDGFTLVEVSLGAFKRHDIAPVVGGQPVPLSELSALERDGKLTREAADEFHRKYSDLAARLAETTSQMRTLGHELDQALAEADREAARPLVEEALEEIRHVVGLRAGEHLLLDQHLEDIRRHLLDIFPVLFSAGEAPPTESSEEGPPDPLEALKVNVLVDRTGQQGRPVVIENQPTPARLLGYMEVQRTPDGAIRADLSGIRAGALHQADGGYLLLNAHDLVAEEGAWTALRRALRTGRAALQVAALMEGAPPPMTPEDAVLDATVILVGSPTLRDGLAQGDEEFSKLFKVTVVLEDRVPLTREAVSSYTAYLARVGAEEHLLPFDATAVARIVENMVRLAGVRNRLSTRFRLLTDMAREASWHAREAAADRVTREHVDLVLAARRDRQGVLSRRILESIEDGVLMLQLTGARVGQVNALAVVETSLERFGYPVRITATTALGLHPGIIDIEREAELSGEIHTKASLILAGYLRSCFAQNHPLAVTASVCFEQSYGGVEGDSASTAELVALLSSLGRVPVRQDLAVTGAVDQQGNVLAVGGVNEKIEGFWRVCRTHGLTGGQGVVIPAASLPMLQLDESLVEDTKAGRFTVFAVHTVGELVDLLTGLPLGEPDELGAWPDGTLGGKINGRLEEMAQRLKAYGGATD